jgi:homoserine kinase
MRKASVNVPASTANVGPGYDVFGIALSLYNTISIQESEQFSIKLTGPKVDDTLLTDETNLVYQAIKKYYNHINKKCPVLDISVDCQIPLSSGLGSSSTAIAGAVAVANKYENDILTTDELVTLAWQIEGHPDNTTPAILGGFVISTITEDNKIAYKSLNWPEEWKILIAHPALKLSTMQARAVLPKQIPLNDAIYNVGRAAFLVSAVCTKDVQAMKVALNDRLHQPYRFKLVPGLESIITRLQHFDILGTVLSGAGPSICIITENNNIQPVKDEINQIWKQEGLVCEFFTPVVDNYGIHYSV